jgi:hypothetical protein
MRYAEALYESTYLEESIQEVVAGPFILGAKALGSTLLKKGTQFAAQQGSKALGVGKGFFAPKRGVASRLKRSSVGTASTLARAGGIKKVKTAVSGSEAAIKNLTKGLTAKRKAFASRLGGGIRRKGVRIPTGKGQFAKAGGGAPSRVQQAGTFLGRSKRVGKRALTNVAIGGLGGAGVGGAVGGLTSDDPIGGAAKGALIGGTSGAIFGPIAGSTTGGRALNLGLSGLGGIGAGNRPKRQRF